MRSFLPKDLEIAAGVRLLQALQVVYEGTGGRLGSRIGPYRFLLLRTRGRKTGILRTAELLYVPDGDNMLVVGSKGGSDSPPAWLLNLQAEPTVEVQVGTRRFQVQARIADGAEHERLWRRVTTIWPDYQRYQDRSRRQIPVVILEPIRADSGLSKSRQRVH